MTTSPSTEPFEALLARVRACTHCAAQLPLPPRPILQASEDARVLIVSQAPGTRAHERGRSFDDPSGDRLRDWLGVTHEEFYDPRRFAIVPAGFCYPGRGASGDAPPRPECAPLWHDAIRSRLHAVRLTLLVGAYAQQLHLAPDGRRGVTATVEAWRDYLPDRIPLPHPSPRNIAWLKRHPWFETDLLPVLRTRVAEVTSGMG